ncbi:MAG: helix-turn-helix domain-containing protein, partial [Hyphomicrobiaceae bacterium]
MSDYLTTKELAALLRIRERKVYDLAASGEVPCSRATGKLLFPRRAIETWISNRSSGGNMSAGRAAARPNVFLGSHDPLLEWALRESECGIATFFDGSLDGLSRYCAGEGIAAGLHIPGNKLGDWNTDAVEEACGTEPVVLLEWATRRR